MESAAPHLENPQSKKWYAGPVLDWTGLDCTVLYLVGADGTGERRAPLGEAAVEDVVRGLARRALCLRAHEIDRRAAA